MYNSNTLFQDLMNLCESTDSFYFVDQSVGKHQFRIFTYRLATFTEFQQRHATECRGHTFIKKGDEWILCSLPMNKFFNYEEYLGWGVDVPLDQIDLIMEKLDGSLISTVWTGSELLFKSKASFHSQQARDATEWFWKQSNTYKNRILETVKNGVTYNFEWTSPNNQIVIGYPDSKLTILNARCMSDGRYITHNVLHGVFEDYLVKSYPIPNNPQQWIKDIVDEVGKEGYVIRFKNGLITKHKNTHYLTIHRTKDSINSPRKLWEACVYECSDDLRVLFINDEVSLSKISEMEAKASYHYNNIHKIVHDFFNNNGTLSRKDYAILGQKELTDSGTFSLAMNLYLGKECDIKSFMVKNYKLFGVSDDGENDE